MSKRATKQSVNNEIWEKNFKELEQQIKDLNFEQLQQEEWEMGVDEAGRGPVLGPMVYGYCSWPIRFKEKLGKIGFDDSKKLNQQQRDDFYQKIKKLENQILICGQQILTPEFLSNQMISGKNNLNALSFNSTFYLVTQVIEQGVNIVKSYHDTVGPQKTFQDVLHNTFSYRKELSFVVEEKADSQFPVVSAASIVAQVTRDREIENWKFLENIENTISREFGSGYPSDPNTQNWLQLNCDPIFAYPNIVRYSWETIQTLFKSKSIPFVEPPTDEPISFLKQEDTTGQRPYLLNTLHSTYDIDF